MDLMEKFTYYRERNLNDEQKKELRRAKRFTNEVDDRESNERVDGFGLCSNCKHLHFREFENGHRSFALCGSYVDNFPTRLSDAYRVTKCSEFDRKGILELETMWAIAHKIDIYGKRQIGFNVQFTPPEEDSVDKLHNITYGDEDE